MICRLTTSHSLNVIVTTLLLALTSSTNASAEDATPSPGAPTSGAVDGGATLHLDPARRVRTKRVAVGSHGCDLPCSLVLDPGTYPLTSIPGTTPLGRLVVSDPGAYQIRDRGTPYRIAGAILLPVTPTGR